MWPGGDPYLGSERRVMVRLALGFGLLPASDHAARLRVSVELGLYAQDM